MKERLQKATRDNSIQAKLLAAVSVLIFTAGILIICLGHLRFTYDYSEQAAEDMQQLIDQGEFKNLKGLLYFTDGKGTFPRKRPPYDAAFILFREDYKEVSVPPWAIRLMLDEEDL